MVYHTYYQHPNEETDGYVKYERQNNHHIISAKIQVSDFIHEFKLITKETLSNMLSDINQKVALKIWKAKWYLEKLIECTKNKSAIIHHEGKINKIDKDHRATLRLRRTFGTTYRRPQGRSRIQ